jgi:hypothetical protein
LGPAGSSSSPSESQKGGDVEGLSLSARSQDLHSDKESPERLRSSSLIPAVLAAESSVTAEPAIRKSATALDSLIRSCRGGGSGDSSVLAAAASADAEGARREKGICLDWGIGRVVAASETVPNRERGGKGREKKGSGESRGGEVDGLGAV